MEDAQDVLGHQGTQDVRPGGGRGGRGCVLAYTGRPQGRGAVMGVAGRIWECRVGLGVREEAGQLGWVRSASCGPCWGAAARREWPLWWPARGVRGVMDDSEGALRVCGVLGSMGVRSL